MSIGNGAISSDAISALGETQSKKVRRPPPKRQFIAKADVTNAPEPR